MEIEKKLKKEIGGKDTLEDITETNDYVLSAALLPVTADEEFLSGRQINYDKTDFGVEINWLMTKGVTTNEILNTYCHICGHKLSIGTYSQHMTKHFNQK